MIVMKHVLLLLSVLAILGCAHGAQVPLSGDEAREAAQDQAELTTTQVSDKANNAVKDQAANLVSNAAMSKAIAVELLRKMPLIDDAKTLIYANMVGQYMAQELVPSLKCRTDGTTWSDVRVGIVKSKSPAAFSLPGGLLFVTTSMIQKMSSEDELAGVLASEMVTSICGKGLPADLAAQAATGWSSFIAGLPTKPLSRGDLLFSDKYALVTLYRRGYDITPYVKFISKNETSGRHGYGIERAAVLEKSVAATPPITPTQSARLTRFNAAKAKSI